MNTKPDKSSWIAFGLFYLVLILIVSVLDMVSQVLRPMYWGAQVALITLGVGIFVLVGIYIPDLSATRGILLAFTIGILTIIPAVLMGLGPIPGLWPQYFFIAFGMAAGSFLTFLSLRFSQRIMDRDEVESEREDIE